MPQKNISMGSIRVGCPAGTKILGGGVTTPGGITIVSIVENSPDVSVIPGHGWFYKVRNDGLFDISFNCYAICVRVE